MAVYVATPKAATLDQFVQVFARSCSAKFPEMALPPHELIASSQIAQSAVDLYATWAIFHLRDANCTIAVDDLQFADDDCSIASFLSQLADSLFVAYGFPYCRVSRKGH